MYLQFLIIVYPRSLIQKIQVNVKQLLWFKFSELLQIKIISKILTQ